MTRDELYRQYEGLAVKAAATVFRQWRKSLTALGVTVEDAVQESKLYLLELAPKLDDSTYTREQRTCYVAKSVRRKLGNWAKRQIKNSLPDTRERPDPPQPDRDGRIDLTAALAQLDPETRSMVMERYDGTWKSLARRHGMSAGQATARVKAGLAKLKAIMHV